MVEAIFGKKIGMTHLFDEKGTVIQVTVIEVGPCTVIAEKEYKDKKSFLIGYQEVTKKRRQNKPMSGYFQKESVPYFRYIKEVRKIDEKPFEKGLRLGSDLFKESEKIDIQAKSIGKGFQGGMKRHNWSGQPGSHGSTSHRRIGSAGASAYPSRIVKGLHMPGHLGNETITVKNMTVVKVDKEKNLIFVKGSCPGHKNTLVLIKKTLLHNSNSA